MYARNAEDRELTFQVSGMLWRRSLVMRDLETETLWSHLLGRAMEGPLAGHELERLPSSMTTWEDWRTRHPETTVLALSRTSRHYRDEAWEYPGRFVYGIPLGPGRPAPAIRLATLQERSVVMIEEDGARLVVTHSPRGGSVQSFSARIEDRALTFEPAGEGRMRDRETGSTWDATGAEALEGPLRGERLREIPGILSFAGAWEAFHPGEPVVE